MNIPLADQIKAINDRCLELYKPLLMSDRPRCDKEYQVMTAVLETLRNINEDMQGFERSLDAWQGFHRDVQDALGLPCSGTQETLAEIKRLKGLEEKEPTV
jgi:hypothetical protein